MVHPLKGGQEMTIWDDSSPETEASFVFSGVSGFAMSALKLAL